MKRWIAETTAAPFFGLGWCVGEIIKGGLWLVSAYMAGYKRGRA